MGLTVLLAPAVALGRPTRPEPRPAPLPLPHNGPPVHLEFEVRADRVHLRLQGEQPCVNPWLGLAADDLLTETPLSEDRAPALVAAFDTFWRTHCPLRIDGEQVFPEIESLELTEAFGGGYAEPIFTLRMNYPRDGWPREVGILWDRFDGTATLEGPRVSGIVRWDPGNDPDFQFFSLTPEEPEFRWHAPPDIGRARVVREITSEPIGARYPAASIGIVALLVLSVPFLRRMRARAPIPLLTGLTLWAGGLGAAVALRDVETEMPWKATIPLPTEEQAIAIFEELHANVYRAFAAQDEDAIYELLSKSVAPELLDELYVEVYESLILRGEGGAVCDVSKIEVEERGVELPAAEAPASGEPAAAGVLAEGELPWFDVNWTWTVEGLVTHWGHQHSRTNKYKARYRVRHDGASWKIASVDVLDHERIQDFGPMR